MACYLPKKEVETTLIVQVLARSRIKASRMNNIIERPGKWEVKNGRVGKAYSHYFMIDRHKFTIRKGGQGFLNSRKELDRRSRYLGHLNTKKWVAPIQIENNAARPSSGGRTEDVKLAIKVFLRTRDWSTKDAAPGYSNEYSANEVTWIVVREDEDTFLVSAPILGLGFFVYWFWSSKSFCVKKGLLENIELLKKKGLP